MDTWGIILKLVEVSIWPVTILILLAGVFWQEIKEALKRITYVKIAGHELGFYPELGSQDEAAARELRAPEPGQIRWDLSKNLFLLGGDLVWAGEAVRFEVKPGKDASTALSNARIHANELGLGEIADNLEDLKEQAAKLLEQDWPLEKRIEFYDSLKAIRVKIRELAQAHQEGVM